MISVIIPVYNTKNELRRCLDSIANQTYKNLEIICVDDGSTDGSELIVDEYAAKDSRFKVVHQENGGESNARNRGLKMAAGQYITFCDCDDWIDEDMYETLLKVIESDNLDMAAASWYREETDADGNAKSTIITNKLPVTDDVINNEMLLNYIYKRDSYKSFAYMWDKLYKREVVCDESKELIYFDEELKLGADVLYLAEAALNTKRCKYIDRAFYHYNQRQESGCHTRNEAKLIHWLKAYETVIRRFEEENVAKETIDYVKRFLAYHSSNAAQIAYENGNGDALREFQRFMRQYSDEYIKLNETYPERIERYKTIINYIL